MFRKTKSRTKLRQRIRSEDDDDESVTTSINNEAATSSVTTGSSANGTAGSSTDNASDITGKRTNVETDSYKDEKVEQRATIVRPKSNSLLSFDDVEGDDVVDFKLKKKDRRSKHMEKLSKKAKEMSVNDIEKVVVKKEVADKKNDYVDNGCEVVIQVKKEATAYNAVGDEDPIRNKFPSTFSQIPDAQAVYEARKKRERMRLMGEDSLIPLDDVQRFKDKSVARARLVREDDNDISDEDDERGRFYSSKNAIDNEEERIRNNRSDFLAVEQGDDDVSDDEVLRWESEQILKGVSFHKVERMEYERARMAAAMQAMMGTFPHVTENSEQLPMEMDVDVPDSDALDASRGKVSGQATTFTLEDILSKLRLRLKESDEVLNAREAELAAIEQNIKENKESISNLELEAPKLSERFHMYQQIRAYVRDLLECISAKVEEIKVVEAQMGTIVNGRAQKFRKRRRQDVHDTYDECSAAAAGKQQTIVRSTDVVQRAAEREARRARRRRLREDTLEGISHEEGLSTDEEETKSEIVARQQAIAEIQQTASTVFVDALDDYCNVEKIIARFVDWLAVDETSFTDAYIQLFIPKILSPFIRLEMLFWNPLENDDVPLHQMQWYQKLLLCASNNANVDPENPIIVSLIPLCIEKVVLNIITDMIEGQWDPLSEKQCKRLGSLLESVVDECPLLVTTSPSVQRLLKTLRQRIQESIDEDLFIPIYSKQAVENVATGCKAFLDRQFWTAVKLVRCLRHFVNILSPECLDALVLEGVANRSWSLALQCSVSNDSSTVRKCRAILKLIPSDSWERYTNSSLRSLTSTLSRVAESLKPKYRDFSRELKKAIGLEK